jgi:hypothetical protein
LTISSPINGIADNALWLETSLEKSFKSSEEEDGSVITSWHDIREAVVKRNAVVADSINAPIFSNSINRVPAVKFDGSDDKYLSIDASFLNNTDYTIIILENRESDKSNNFILGSSTNANEANANQNLVIGYNSDSNIIHSQSSDNNYTASITSYQESRDKPKIITITNSKETGKNIYINSLLAATSNNTDHLSNISTLTIGQGYNGQIGEIAIFTRSLKDDERTSIEDYLSQKWKVKLLRDQTSSCLNGAVSPTGCIIQCQVDVTGSSDNTPKNDSTSGEILCDQAGYFGSIPYTCSNGETITGSCECDTSNGYTSVNGVCEGMPCAVNVTGSSDNSAKADNSSGEILCDQAGYFGSIPYTCSNGETITGSCGCDISNNYTSDGMGGCISTLPCTINNQAGIIDGTEVAFGSTSLTCNEANYTGTINYTCYDATLSDINNNCELPICVGGTESDVTIDGTSYHLHTFTSVGNSTLTCYQSTTAQVLVVAGGGGGGGNGGGGGGGGGVVFNDSTSITAGNYDVVVGDGGSGHNSTPSGHSGGNSSINISGISTAIGGGAGGGRSGDIAQSGGSGGGGGGSGKIGSTPGSGTPNQGNAGGAGSGINGDLGCDSAGGGGGGYSSAGSSGALNQGGNGGAGYTSLISGSSVVYGSGGGGGRTCAGGNIIIHPGIGIGGTGAGNGAVGSKVGENATGFGSGGGGGSGQNYIGGNGKQGIVIIRYAN